MTKWDSLNLDAPHTQRELDEMPQAFSASPSQFWREECARKQDRIERLEDRIDDLTLMVATLRAQLADRDYRC